MIGRQNRRQWHQRFFLPRFGRTGLRPAKETRVLRPEHVFQTEIDGKTLTTVAPTKSEARAALKDANGGQLPPGTEVVDRGPVE